MKMSFLIMFLSGCLSFTMKRKYLLLMLLSLEFLVLTLFFGLFMLFNMSIYESFFSMVFICFSVCESVLGLSLLVLMIRTYGNDYFQTFGILW